MAKTLGERALLSLAGITKTPLSTPHRVGGFGGVGGLVSYLRASNISAIIDATHPFASQMSNHAASAAAHTNLPLLRLERPAWAAAPKWQPAPNLYAAAAALPRGARAFLTIGSRSLGAFIGRNDLWCLTRAIEPPENAPRGEVILQRPPFTLEGEIALLTSRQISHLVSKNAGGTATAAKLEAAKQLGISVIMIERPALAPAATVDTIAQALKWVAETEGIK